MAADHNSFANLISWVSPKDMKVDRIDDSEDHITEAALDESTTQLVPVESVLVVVRGMIAAAVTGQLDVMRERSGTGGA